MRLLNEFVNLLLWFLGVIVVIICIAAWIVACVSKEMNDRSETIDHELLEEYYISGLSAEKSAEWERMIYALIEVESSGRDSVEGDGGQAFGCLQIHPCIVEDCNRIIGSQRYTLSDRIDRAKSIEMFRVIQGHYNPDSDVHLALKIWNPGAPISYHRKVISAMNQ